MLSVLAVIASSDALKGAVILDGRLDHRTDRIRRASADFEQTELASTASTASVPCWLQRALQRIIQKQRSLVADLASDDWCK